MPAYADSIEDEAVQTELIENAILFFHHPAMEALIY